MPYVMCSSPISDPIPLCSYLLPRQPYPSFTLNRVDLLDSSLFSFFLVFLLPQLIPLFYPSCDNYIGLNPLPRPPPT